jgi:hypothetical protein
VRQPIEEEPFVLSDGPPLSVREALAKREAYALAEAQPESFAAPGARTPIERVDRSRLVPVVHATIADHPTLLLVDTGAYDHILHGWFVHVLQEGEAATKSEAVVDHAARSVSVERWSSLSFAIDGWSPLAPIKPAVLGDENLGPRAIGIGGILSPQRLATAGRAVALDFPANEMAEVSEAAATARLGAHGSFLGVATSCDGAHYVLAATVEGKPAQLIVDTGSFTTDLKASSSPGRALAGRSSIAREIYTVGGPVETRVLSDAELKAGQLSTKLDVRVVSDRTRASRCPHDGVLGMDVLRACVLVMDASRMRIACG